MTRYFPAFVALALVACAKNGPAPAAPTASEAETTSAPITGGDATKAETSAKPSDPAPTASNEMSATCRTKRPGGGTTELLLEWKGEEAKGLLRTTAPSGEITTQKVRAEKHKGMIVADDLNAVDLVDHAALVRQQDGKTMILLSGHDPIWSACE